jgi:hypothetical protein
VRQAVKVPEEGADLPRRAGRGRDAQGLGGGLQLTGEVRDGAPEFDEAAPVGSQFIRVRNSRKFPK